jgi:hypothetical protein
VGKAALRFVVEDVPQGAFHYNSPIVNLDAAAPEDMALKLQQAGASTLMALLEPHCRAVRSRAQLHFDRSWRLGEVPPFMAEHCKRALELVFERVIPRRLPEWAWLF